MEILLLVISLLALLVFGGFLYQAIGTAIDRRRFPPPGRMLDVSGVRLHWIDPESNAPAVIFESGISASCLNWTHVRTEVAQFARACAYDRAGLGWSERAFTARVTSQIIQELHALLAEAGISSPYVLVGHSFGGLLVSAYATQHPSDVSGLILVDPLPVAEWLNPPAPHSRTLRRGVRLARRGALLARIGLVRLSLRLLTSGARQIPKGIAKLTSGRGETLVSRLVGEVRKMPRDTWPIIQAHWSQPKGFEAMADYLEALPASSAQAASLGALPPIPVTILSASHTGAALLAERDEIARRSPLGRHIVARDSGHWIHLDEPQLVVESIREMVVELSGNRGSPRAS